MTELVDLLTSPLVLVGAERWQVVADAYSLCELSGVPLPDLDELVLVVGERSGWIPTLRLETDRGPRLGLMALTQEEFDRHRPYGTERHLIEHPVDNLAAGMAQLARWYR